MGIMGVHNMQHTMASLKQLQTLGTVTHLLFENQSDSDMQQH